MVQILPGQVIEAEEGLQATLVVPYVEFVLMEVLKNSLQVRVAHTPHILLRHEQPQSEGAITKHSVPNYPEGLC